MHAAEGAFDGAILVLLANLAKLIKAIFEFAAVEHHVNPVAHTRQATHIPPPSTPLRSGVALPSARKIQAASSVYEPRLQPLAPARPTRRFKQREVESCEQGEPIQAWVELPFSGVPAQDRRVLAQEALNNLGERQSVRPRRIPALSLSVVAPSLVLPSIVATCSCKHPWWVTRRGVRSPCAGRDDQRQ